MGFIASVHTAVHPTSWYYWFRDTGHPLDCCGAWSHRLNSQCPHRYKRSSTKATLFYQDSDIHELAGLVDYSAYRDRKRPRSKRRRFYVSLDSIRDETTYAVPTSLNINNYKGRFGTKAVILPLPRIRRMRTQRVLIDVAASEFLDPTSHAFLPPTEPVYILLLGCTKVVQWRHPSRHNPS